MQLIKYSNGIKIKSNFERVYPHPGNSSRRGSVSGFSVKSCRRLRDLLLRLDLPANCQFVNITLTLPFNIDVDEWHNMLKRYRMFLIRHRLSLIWRVELQRRSVPHLHCVGIVRDISDVSNYWLGWLTSAPSSCRNHPFFAVYGVDIRYLSSVRWFVYMLEHMVKNKKEQLGWKGRQWGIINRSVLCFDDGKKISIDENSVLEILRNSGYDTDELHCHFSRFGNDNDDLIKSLIDCVIPF